MATGTLGTSARDYHTRQRSFISVKLDGTASGNFNSNTAQVTVGTIPAGSHIVAMNMGTRTVFNAGTTQTLKIGTTAGGAELLASAAAGMVILGVTQLTPIVAGSGPFAADTTVTVTNTSTGTLATTGDAVVVVEYVTHNQ